MADRIPFEQVNDKADSASEVHEIDVCLYGMEHYPKGYTKVSQVGPMPDGGEWDADWHPQGDHRHGPNDSDYGPHTTGH